MCVRVCVWGIGCKWLNVHFHINCRLNLLFYLKFNTSEQTTPTTNIMHIVSIIVIIIIILLTLGKCKIVVLFCGCKCNKSFGLLLYGKRMFICLSVCLLTGLYFGGHCFKKMVCCWWSRCSSNCSQLRVVIIQRKMCQLHALLFFSSCHGAFKI